MTKFEPEQVHRLIFDLQYLRFAKVGSARTFLQKLTRDASELQPVLRQYPVVRYEPLDYHYVVLKYLSALTSELMEDLCSGSYDWRGIATAAWLLCLRPGADLTQALAPWTNTALEPNRWLVTLALAETNNTTWDGDPEIPHLLRSLRASLAPLPRPDFSLKKSPAAARLAGVAIQVRQAYRAGGLPAAQDVLRNADRAA